jgi:Raf kinase inhibitor-like YbhB/YbcL family protein
MTTHTAMQTPLVVTSPSFSNDGEIPRVHTCEGRDQPFPLAISGVPESARSLAIVVHDPDAPDPRAPSPAGWTHWVVYDLPPTTTSISAAALPAGARDGQNDWQTTGYRGPCPPIGAHRYVTTVYALDTVLPDLQRPSRAMLLDVMEGHVVARGELVGLYEKEKKK